ncbi:MAG: hypothetical protein RMJ36_06290 [Candidatus Calescibacterium sp.]|nr:hypothetical protein [Candidatus Calescibacterium sp.]MDW8133245.1 hypothetical protein [Candidatus Calescibacterium sp.]
MNYFPLSMFQDVVEFAISNKLISNKKIAGIKAFFNQLSKLSQKNIREVENNDYIQDMFSKEEFLQIYALYLTKNDINIKELFVEIPYINLDEVNFPIEESVEINEKIRKIIEKNYTFVFKVNDINYLVISFPLERVLYSEIRNIVGPYKLVVGYPYDVFKICDRIVEEIGKKIFDSAEFITQQDIIELLEYRKAKKSEQRDPVEEQSLDLKIDIRIDGEKERSVLIDNKKDKISHLIKKKKFLIIASPATNDYEVVSSFVDAGVEIVKLHLNITHPVSKKKIGSYEREKENILKLVIDYPNVVWGIVPGNILTDRDSFEEIEYSQLEAFFDFIDLFYYSYTPHYLNSSLNKMVAVDRVLSKEELQELNRYKFFGIEASVVDKDFYGFPLTLKDITDYRRLIENTDIPVFIPTQKRIIPSDVSMLYSIGAKGIVLGQISTSFNIDSIKKITTQFLEYSYKI